MTKISGYPVCHSVDPADGQVHPELWSEDDVLPVRLADRHLPRPVRGGGPLRPRLLLETPAHSHHVLSGDTHIKCRGKSLVYSVSLI